MPIISISPGIFAQKPHHKNQNKINVPNANLKFPELAESKTTRILKIDKPVITKKQFIVPIKTSPFSQNKISSGSPSYERHRSMLKKIICDIGMIRP